MSLFTEALLSSKLTALPLLWWLVPFSGLVAVCAAFYFYKSMMKRSEGTAEMIEIARAVREGAVAYLRRQYKTIALVFGVMFLVFLAMAYFKVVSPIMPFAFILGGLFSATSGIVGMRAATYASARTANAARESLNSALQVAFRGGAVMGFSVVGFAMLNLSILFLVLYYLIPHSWYRGTEPMVEIATIMVSGAFGASLVALFARVGGGIFTKAADVGADLVGKLEANIPEDDPRNPATIADNVGDNVGDVAGLGADLYESNMGSIMGAAVLGVSVVVMGGGSEFRQLQYFILPLAIAALGVLVSLAGVFLVRVKEGGRIFHLVKALERGVIGTSIGVAVLSLPLIFGFQLDRPWFMWGTILVGLGIGFGIGRVTEYYTASEYKPTLRLVKNAESGAAPVIIEGLAMGMQSAALPVVIICVGIAASFYMAGGGQNMLMGLYGVGLSSVAMLSTLGITMSTDAYGPIADNAGGNAQMVGLPPEVRRRTDDLDAVGNTTAATGKGFAIGSAALTSLVLLAAFVEQVRFETIYQMRIDSLLVEGDLIPIFRTDIHDFILFYDVTLLNPAVIIGMFLGAMNVYLFCGLTISAVGQAAHEMVQEVRDQFRRMPGIMNGTQKPDYARCVEISTAGAQKEMVKPALVAVIAPVLVGVLFGVAGIMGLLAGSLASGFVLALMMANSGGAWDNAKKYIENGAGAKGSPAHKAAVVGDTVGDPFKDTAGPSIDILIKLMSIVAVILAGLIVSIGKGGLMAKLIGLF
ncbi:MAG: sodium-translocating pyrophosphatase [Anaerolineaceae bacterium]|nr:sodium-translocating pyrophosphatase [Anaerolineaceae bacterium]